MGNLGVFYFRNADRLQINDRYARSERSSSQRSLNAEELKRREEEKRRLEEEKLKMNEKKKNLENDTMQMMKDMEELLRQKKEEEEKRKLEEEKRKQEEKERIEQKKTEGRVLLTGFYSSGKYIFNSDFDALGNMISLYIITIIICTWLSLLNKVIITKFVFLIAKALWSQVCKSQKFMLSQILANFEFV